MQKVIVYRHIVQSSHATNFRSVQGTMELLPGN